MSPAVEAQSPNHWTVREFPLEPFLIPSILPHTDMLGSNPLYHVAFAIPQAFLSVTEFIIVISGATLQSSSHLVLDALSSLMLPQQPLMFLKCPKD